MDIHYAKASLYKHEHQTERRTLGLSWFDSGGKNHRIKFNLTNRIREYLANIPDSEQLAWPRHQQTVRFAQQTDCETWIGKGLEFQKYVQGQPPQSRKRFEKTSALLEFHPEFNRYELGVWILDSELHLSLYPTNNQYYSYQGEWQNQQTEQTVSIPQEWL